MTSPPPLPLPFPFPLLPPPPPPPSNPLMLISRIPFEAGANSISTMARFPPGERGGSGQKLKTIPPHREGKSASEREKNTVKITINVPLFKKLRDIIFFVGQ